MGLFKSIKDVRNLTEQAKDIQKQQQEQAGYKPGMRGMLAQMGDMVEDAGQQLSQLQSQGADQSRLLTEGIPAEGVIVAMGTPARGASTFNLDIDLEVRIPGRDPYRVANSYMVSASAQIGPGVVLPVRVDAQDPSKVAIDWSGAAQAPARGDVRPATTSPQPEAASAPDGDEPAPAERLAKLQALKDAGAISDDEFDSQRQRILDSI